MRGVLLILDRSATPMDSKLRGIWHLESRKPEQSAEASTCQSLGSNYFCPWEFSGELLCVQESPEVGFRS